MANLNETDNWANGIYQLEEDDPVLGGPAGITNQPPKQLASRTLYQRLRNVTPWIEDLPYSANVAYVSHAATTWKSAAASTGVEPGTDVSKWVRWGHTEAELSDALGHSVAAHEERPDPHQQYALWEAIAYLISRSGEVPDRASGAQLEAVMRGRYSRTTYLTAGAGTYVVPAGVRRLRVQMWGGGGGGGGANQPGSAAGGGAGGYAFGEVDVMPGQSISYWVGVGGTPGESTPTAGGTGGTSGFGGFLSATGGGGGQLNLGGISSVPGAGGHGTGSSMKHAVAGSSGGQGYQVPGGHTGGLGGAPYMGSISLQNVASAGVSGMSPGAGGSGAASASSGGYGAGGLIMIEEFL